MKNGIVYLIGAGPGDPDLITLKAIKRLGLADVVIYDYLSNPYLLKYAKEEAELVCADFRGKRTSDGYIFDQSIINRLIIEKAKQGKTVARLKGGDPFVFGRGGEEAEVCVENRIQFEIVPGVTAASGVAYAGIPLTHRKYASSVSFITGHEDPNKKESSVDWDNVSRKGTLVFYMGVENILKIAKKLTDAGRDPKTPAAMIEWATTGRERVVEGTLQNIAELSKKEKVKAPALIVVGEVISLRKKLDWRKHLPLSRKTIVVTRSHDQASTLSNKLSDLGADVIEFPTIEIVPPKNFKPLDNAVKNLKKYQFVVFTSRNGVQFFFERLKANKSDSRALKGIIVSAIGPGTADELLKHGIKPDIRANCDYSQEGLLKELLRKDVSGKNILIPRAEKAREILAKKLKEAGACVLVAVAYRTVKPKVSFNPFEQKVDMITFTSSSTVSNFISIFGKKKAKKLLKAVKIISIGRITTAAAKKFGLKVDVQAKKSTIDGLVEAVK